MRRRTLLGSIPVGLSFFAGCTALLSKSENDSPQTTTTKPSPTATSTATPTQTPTPTETPTPTATPTQTPPPTPTETSTPTQVTVPTPPRVGTRTAAPVETQTLTLHSDTQLETYTNEVYRYQIDYPPRWSIDESDPRNAFITSSIVRGYVLIQVFSVEQFTGGRSVSELSKLVNIAITNTQSLPGFELLDKNRTTLDNGQPAYLMDLQFDDQNTQAGLVHTKYLVTKLGGTVYEAQFYWPVTAYTDKVDRIASQIITSFSLLI